MKGSLSFLLGSPMTSKPTWFSTFWVRSHVGFFVYTPRQWWTAVWFGGTHTGEATTEVKMVPKWSAELSLPC